MSSNIQTFFISIRPQVLVWMWGSMFSYRNIQNKTYLTKFSCVDIISEWKYVEGWRDFDYVKYKEKKLLSMLNLLLFSFSFFFYILKENMFSDLDQTK